jgi:DNA-binding IclR family transcriptional regulator
MDNNGRASLVQSVDRAVTILEVLARRGEVGVSELATELGVHKSTAFRLVNALADRGLVEQPGERGKYRLGMGIIRLAGATTARLDLTQQSRPVSEKLAAEVGETVNIAVGDGDVAINIDQVLGSAAVSSYNWVGQRTPLHATSSGKVLLAYYPVSKCEAILAGPLEQFTPNTVTDPDYLRDELMMTMRDGYGYTIEELEIGLNAVAAPIHSYDRRVIAALSVSGPSFRLTSKRIHELAPRVIACADDISGRLGYAV